MAKKKSPFVLTSKQLAPLLAERTGFSLATVKAVLDNLQVAAHKAVSTNGKMVIPGICIVEGKEKPAVKGGEKAINPFTKETYITKPRPASTAVKFRAVKALRDAASS